MPKIEFTEIIDSLSKKQYRDAMINAHDFVQLALYQAIMSALWYLGETDKLHIYLQKYMSTYKVSTFWESEIDEAYKLGLISEDDRSFIKELKDFRDSQGVAHHTLYFNKEVEENPEKRKQVEQFIYKSEETIRRILGISKKINIAHIQDSIKLSADKSIKVGDIIKLGHTKEELLDIVKTRQGESG